MFFLHFLYSEETGLFSTWVVGVGSEEEMRKFRFRMKFSGGEEEVLYEGPVTSIDRSSPDVFKNKNVFCFAVERVLLEKIWNEEEQKIDYEFELFEKKK